MNLIIKELLKCFRIYGSFIRNNLASLMEYRIHFYSIFLIQIGYLCLKILYVVVTYKAGVMINGLTPDEVMLFAGVYVFITGIAAAVFFKNFEFMPRLVREGALDAYITKPISLQFMISFRFLDLGAFFPNTIGGLVMIFIAWNRLDITISFYKIAGFLALMIGSLTVAYGIMLIPPLIVFWIIRPGPILSFAYSLWDINNMPMSIYNKGIQRAGIYAIPIFVISNFPAMFLLDRMTPVYMIWALIVPFMMLAVSRVVWHYAIRNYTSASS
jgi:ABC-2 type transport system permease protein